jgi:hypothetical protein
MRFAVSFLVLLVSSSLLAGVETGHDETADFSKYRTYGWREGTPAALPEVQEWVVTAVDRELQGKGLNKVEGQADVYVSIVAYAQMDLAMRNNFVSLDRWDGWGISTSYAVDTTVGHLMVDLLDGETDEPVWRAIAEEKVQASKIPKLEGKINKIVKKMFKDYPPD